MSFLLVECGLLLILGVLGVDLHHLGLQTSRAQVLTQGVNCVETLEGLAEGKYTLMRCRWVLKGLQDRFVCRELDKKLIDLV